MARKPSESAIAGTKARKLKLRKETLRDLAVRKDVKGGLPTDGTLTSRNCSAAC